MSHKYGTYFVWRDYFLGHSLELKVKKRPFSTPQKSKMSYFLTSTRQHVNTSTRQHVNTYARKKPVEHFSGPCIAFSTGFIPG